MQDTYMIGINATFSSEYGTVCTEDYGDCGLVLDFSHQGFLITHAVLDVTIVRAHSRIFLPEWTSTEIVSLLMVGIEQKRFGQSPKHSAMPGKLASLHRGFFSLSEYIFS